MDRFKSAMAQAKKMQQYCELKVISLKREMGKQTLLINRMFPL